ncbi:MAG: DUF4838 domain-containing protein [Planctomycetota bacterium]|nr:DUF4838 domain-containing protein [Planctomycetota bacterium]MDA1142891.1 DUF4838 domain-containing protein [Planctomycetota bacterium]
MNSTSLALLLSLCFVVFQTNAADLVLAADGKSDYQIIVPDASPSPAIGECLQQTARLFQATFKANGFELTVVSEDKRDQGKPGIYLGNTAFAGANGIEVKKLKGWGYVHKVVGRDLIIAGHDHPAPSPPKGSRPRTGWDLIGTAKGVTDFLREYAGARFLYPDLGAWSSIQAAANLDFLKSPAFEFLPTDRLVIPSDLDVQKTPHIKFNVSYPLRGSFYDIANNLFPLVDDVFGGHTYARAVPMDKYGEPHPEYFALVGGNRLTSGHGQYCISNSEFQELVYQDLIGWLDLGYETVDLGQPDGFRACQCGPCNNLYDTGSDWSEKLWILHRKLAERVQKARPGKMVTMMSYILTEQPPKTFKVFPKNTRIMWCGTNEEDIAPWREYEVPGGFTAYIYNWTPNLSSRYTPMRTPLTIELQAKRLYHNKVQSLYRDGPGALHGLEGPVYYLMGRIFDDPENMQAKFLVHEFCGAAFGKSAGPMLRFYDALYHAVEPYSQYLGTRDPAWTYRNIYGQGRKMLADPFRLLSFLYTPLLLESLQKQLSLAEKSADTEKIKARLALVSREFNYLKNLMRVVYLYQAYQIQPDLASRDRLLDAIDARNAEIDSYYNKKGWTQPMGLWSFVMFPPMGHDANHLRLAYDRYQEPFAETVFNWDTKAMRSAPLPGAKRFAVAQAKGPVTIDAATWEIAPTYEFANLAAGAEGGARPRTQIPLPVPGLEELEPEDDVVDKPRKTVLRSLFDKDKLYLRIESELPAALMKQSNASRKGDLTKEESLEVYLEPLAGSDSGFRFIVGVHPESKEDAASGFITDAMDPRHGKFDPDWNGAWTYESRLDQNKNIWLAFITIPYKTLGAEPPAAESFWRGNLGRNHFPAPGLIRHSALSVNPQTKGASDQNSFAELVFHVPGSEKTASPEKNPLKEWRDKYYAETFELPAEWKELSNPLHPLENWLFRTDPLEQGIKDGWHGIKVSEKEWLPARIPSFWAEIGEVGNYQGVGWYRTTINVPADWNGKTLRLLFGSVDEQAWVYINGHLVKEHSEKSEGKSYNELWEEPFTVEVKPEHLNYGKPNILAVRVLNSKANGGIWRAVLGHAISE